MVYPEEIMIKNRKIQHGYGVLSGIYLNAPAGGYNILGIATGKEEFEFLPKWSKGRPFARILTITPGVLAVIEPQEVITVDRGR